MKYFILTGLAAVLAVGIGYADQSTGGVVVAISKTPASSGKLMYASYCSSCHGLDLKGNGPTAQVLKKQPADLTLLTKNNRGRFPFDRVRSVLEFGSARQAGEDGPMPVWGPILAQMDAAHAGQGIGMVRIISLTQYLESLQSK
jgi:mono/diheme cytochrome c family protein